MLSFLNSIVYIVGIVTILCIVLFSIYKIIGDMFDTIENISNKDKYKTSSKDVNEVIKFIYGFIVMPALNPRNKYIKILTSLFPKLYARFVINIIQTEFGAGYCWQFAHILKDTFDRGKVCWLCPYYHFVWLDIDGNVYDITGNVRKNKYSFCIPENYLPASMRKDFALSSNINKEYTIEDFMDITENYNIICCNNGYYNKNYIRYMIERSIFEHEIIKYEEIAKTRDNTFLT